MTDLKFVDEISQTFNETYGNIAHDLIEPQGTISREDIFEICCDITYHNIEGEVGTFWVGLTKEQKWEYIPHVFCYEFYECGVAEEY